MDHPALHVDIEPYKAHMCQADLELRRFGDNGRVS
jgi:hypothetical protein